MYVHIYIKALQQFMCHLSKILEIVFNHIIFEEARDKVFNLVISLENIPARILEEYRPGAWSLVWACLAFLILKEYRPGAWSLVWACLAFLLTEYFLQNSMPRNFL